MDDSFSVRTHPSGSLVRDSIVKGHTFGLESYHRMISVASAVLAVAKSTDYDLDPFIGLYSELLAIVADARDRDNLTGKRQLRLWNHLTRFFIFIMIKVCSLASVLNIMSLYAPVFRRASPESSQELVNLPRALTALEIHLKLFVTLDVVLGVVTNRPMFFRYSLEFPSPDVEELLNSENSPGLRWLYGVPDRLVVMLARMNTLLENFGSYMDRETVQALEQEIEVCKPVAASTMDPVLKLGRLVVQECWRLVASIYLYMALCGAGSKDARVVRVQKKFMNVVGGVKPRRNPDSFLIIPMMVAGVATISPTDQSTLLTRIWGVSECSKQGTFGNDMIRMLNDIWARTTDRPAVWSDLRVACLRVTGM